MEWYQRVFELIDMRSFSNLWYWIALAVVWSTTSHWVLGVPMDMITRAKKSGGEMQTDLEDMVRININRLLHIGQEAGLILTAFLCFLITALAILGFYYQVEFAQALFLLALPLSIVGVLSLSTARLIRTENSTGELLHKRLRRHRTYTQMIGMLAIFVTAMWGMYFNITNTALGG